MNHGVASIHRAIYGRAVAQVAAGEIEREPCDSPGGPRGMDKRTGLECTRQCHHLTQAPADEPGRTGHQHATRTLGAHEALASAGGRGAAVSGGG